MNESEPLMKCRNSPDDVKTGDWTYPGNIVAWACFHGHRTSGIEAGVDGQSIEEFEGDLQNNLYKIWNRMSSGSYMPSAVLLCDIPKSDGKVRTLGIPTVAAWINPVVRGWINYYGAYCKSALQSVMRTLDFQLAKWAMRKFKRYHRRIVRALRWLDSVYRRDPNLFAHHSV